MGRQISLLKNNGEKISKIFDRITDSSKNSKADRITGNSINEDDKDEVFCSVGDVPSSL